jgi:hypothetical protein
MGTPFLVRTMLWILGYLLTYGSGAGPAGGWTEAKSVGVVARVAEPLTLRVRMLDVGDEVRLGDTVRLIYVSRVDDESSLPVEEDVVDEARVTGEV